MAIKLIRRTAAVVLVVSVFVAFAVLLLPRLFGWMPYVVTSGSMRPTIAPGAVVLSAPADSTQLHRGDIITFRTADGLTTHRIMQKGTVIKHGTSVTSFKTKGDANSDADPGWVDSRNVLGRAVLGVPLIGFLVQLVKTPVGAALLAALFLFVVFSGGGSHPRKANSDSADTAVREAVPIA